MGMTRRGSYKYLMLALVIAEAQAGQRERFNARETLERAKVGTYSPSAQPPMRVVVERPARIRAFDHDRRQRQRQFERMDCNVDEPTGATRCVVNAAEEVNHGKSTRSTGT